MIAVRLVSKGHRDREVGFAVLVVVEDRRGIGIVVLAAGGNGNCIVRTKMSLTDVGEGYSYHVQIRLQSNCAISASSLFGTRSTGTLCKQSGTQNNFCLLT